MGVEGCRDVLCNIVLYVQVLTRDSDGEAKPVNWYGMVWYGMEP